MNLPGFVWKSSNELNNLDFSIVIRVSLLGYSFYKTELSCITVSALPDILSRHYMRDYHCGTRQNVKSKFLFQQPMFL